jgi:hypothetical protein
MVSLLTATKACLSRLMRAGSQYGNDRDAGTSAPPSQGHLTRLTLTGLSVDQCEDTDKMAAAMASVGSASFASCMAYCKLAHTRAPLRERYTTEMN